MPRVRVTGRRSPLEPDWIELQIGPDADYEPAVLAAVYERNREALLHSAKPGQRPWATWHLEIGERRPSTPEAEAIRLAELGLLSRGEVAAISERGTEAKLRIGTDAELISGGTSIDAEAVELAGAVRAAGGQG